MWEKFLSRKFVIALLVLIFTSITPPVFKSFEIVDMVTMMALGIFASVGAGYGLINVKDRKIELQEEKEDEVKKDAA